MGGQRRSAGHFPARMRSGIGIGRRSRLLATTALVACIAGAGQALAGQLTAAAFQAYDAADAGSIVAGPGALYSVSLDAIHPTQMNEGLTEVGKKIAGFDLESPSQLQADLLTDIEPVVIGPGGQLYVTDGHHTFTALQESVYGASNPTVYVNVIANYSNLTQAQFWAQMQAANLVFPIDNGVAQAFDTSNGSPLPASLTGLTNDPYRGLEYSILKNKSSTLFKTSANITGAAGVGTPGLDKMAGYYADFIEADAYRGANEGRGLAYLSPGDIAYAAKWNLTPTSQTSLPGIAGTVTAAQLPGFILGNDITISDPVSDATMAGGALDGNGTFTGITSLTNGSVTIGTPKVGFVMQLGADNGHKVTLSGANTYTGGTTILAGTLVAASDASLGAAPGTFAYPTDPGKILSALQSANGIIFNSLEEGNGTLQIGTTAGGGTQAFTTDRPIGVGGEAATIDVNGYVVTLGGPIVSLGALGTGVGNQSGTSDITVDDNSAGSNGVLVLQGDNPDFYGNWIIGNNGTPTLRVMDDAALGATTGPAALIGAIDLNGGILQTGADIDAPERNIFLDSGSSIDTDGHSSTWGTLTDIQRTLVIDNTDTANKGSLTFDSMVAGGTATLQLAGGTAGVDVTFTNGITREGAGTLVLQPQAGTTLGGTSPDAVFSGDPGLVNGIAPTWIVTNNGGKNAVGPYDFVGYDSAKGYVVATYSSSLGNDDTAVVKLGSATTLSGDGAAFALNTNGQNLDLGGHALTLGDGTDAAGLIMNGASTNAISDGALDFGASEGVIWLSGTKNAISTTISGSNGLTFAGSGSVTLTGNISLADSSVLTIDSGTVTLGTANMLSSGTAVVLADTKSHPAAATLALTAGNRVAALDSAGNNAAVTLNNAALTIGDAGNLDSTYSGTITQKDGGVGTEIVIDTAGLVDFSGMSSKSIVLNASSSIDIEKGDLRVGASAFKNTNNIATASGTEIQFAQNGGGVFAGNITGGGALHLIGGTLQLTGTGNSYAGGTIVEQGSTLDLTTANVSSGNADIVNAGGLVDFDQATDGTYNGVISDGTQMEGGGATLSGSLLKDDSSGANSGNLTLAQVQAYTGFTYVEAGTLTLGAKDAVATSAGVVLGRVGGEIDAGAVTDTPTHVVTLALGNDETLQSLTDEADNLTEVALNGHTLTLGQSGTVVNPDASFTFNGVIADGTGGAGSLVKDGKGIATLGGANTYSGATDVKAGVLQAGAAGSFSANSDFTVESGAMLDLQGFDQTVKGLSNAGLVSFAGTKAGTTLTVTGNYAGNGGNVAMRAYLQGGGAADLLHIEGDATGTTSLTILNQDAGGTATTGQGIKVVQVDGAADASAFKLAQAVEAGAYEYNLFYDGTAGAPDPEWDLRTIGLSPSAQTARPYAAMLGNFAEATLGSLEERNGNRIWPNGAARVAADLPPAEAMTYAPQGPTIAGAGAWGRIGGQYSSYDPKHGTSYTQGIGFLQAGYEGTLFESGLGTTTMGAFATVGTSRADIDLTPDPVTGAARKGKITMTGYGVGANLTWLGDDGLYADGLGQFTWYDSDLSNKAGGNNQGYSTALSLEVGKRFDLGNGWAVVPQTQLAWTHVDFDDFTDIDNASVKLGNGDSLKGRAGLRLENLASWQGADGQPNRLQVYGIANVSYEFLNGTKVDVAGLSLQEGQKDLWGEVGLGGTYAWDRNWSLYGEASYGMALASAAGDNYTVKGSVGLRYKW
ncbi:autotransporter outer membrane beta-barrel domain-containing protein [Labrys monachus]|uniref:Outer membrane autotransporter protein n=1 Tax=Labrys monachus TaxID=217067 RepID=A0ABU0F7N5_9HYPH|nr:autotransporter outer membrane beta-barrel domain-containing protein [Labrys monachus]MDQ0390623.1 outer membrane autotransporter protein [Labrys monachus]